MIASFLGPFVDLADGPSAQDASPTAGTPGANILDVTIQPQSQSNWCWAAVAASVSDYYAKRGGPAAQSQCQLATTFLNAACCLDPMPPPDTDWPGNKEFSLDLPLSTLGLLAGSKVSSAASFPAIRQEVSAGRPIGCHISWSSGDGHFVCIIGVDEALKEVVVRDPAGLLTEGSYPFSDAATFPGGVWDETYFTQ